MTSTIGKVATGGAVAAVGTSLIPGRTHDDPLENPAVIAKLEEMGRELGLAEDARASSGHAAEK